MSMSIKRKLTLMTLGVSMAAVVLTVMAITTYLIYDMRASQRQELAVTAALTADRNGAALLFLDNERAEKNLEIFRLSPAVALACVYNAQGQLFAGYQANGLQCASSRDAIAPLGGNMLTTAEVIVQNGNKVGEVYIASDTRAIDAYVQKILHVSVQATAVMLFITLMLTVYFQRTISEPILNLAATVKSITASRNYTLEARADSCTETRTLAEAFNAMLAEVRKRDAELVSANDSLEAKVVERTRELDYALRKAEQASEAKSEFLRNMSHEFRTPLHALVSFSSYGMREYETSPPSKLKEYFEIIQKCSMRLTRLVNEVLDLARMEQGQSALNVQTAEIGELAGRAVELVRPLLAEKNLALTCEGGALARCDDDKIVQVITNLVGNAIKFTPAGKRIAIAMSEKDDSVTVAVRDEGIGIPAGEEEMIFESFRQSSRTNTGAGGTGLGLAICRKIIEAHGGRIWAQNHPDGGTCVTFTLPGAKASRHLKEAGYENAA